MRQLSAAYVAAVLVLAPLCGGAATVPIGPPESHVGDDWPAPLRTLWVDRCGRGATGVCGSVRCSDGNTGLVQNAPLCTLGAAGARAQAGDVVEIRAGTDGGRDGYWEVDDVGGKWPVATLSPNVKGTARCVGGARPGWDCTNDASCGAGGVCEYRPIVWHAYEEADGSRARVDPMGKHPPDLGGTNCWGGIPGRFRGFNFGNPACVNARNDRLVCYGGSTEGKPCSVDGARSPECGDGVCSAAPWHHVVDGLVFSNWHYWDSRTGINDRQNRCSEYALSVSGAGCSTPVGVTVQNCRFEANGGGGVLWAYRSAGNRWFNNAFVDNISRGYTTQMNIWDAEDKTMNRVTYMWGNRILNGADYVPSWAHGGTRWWDGGPISECLPPDPASPPVLVCHDGPNAGRPCSGEGLDEACGYGHCGPPCVFDAAYNGNPPPQGYSCECTQDSQCAGGLTCQPAKGSGPSGNTEGRGIIVDRGGHRSAFDIRNNVIADNQGDCISVFLGDGGRAGSPGVIAHNTCYHNAEKGASYAELNLISRYVDVYNNLIVPTPQATCKAGPRAGQPCSRVGSAEECGGFSASFGCELPTHYQYDNTDAFACPGLLCYTGWLGGVCVGGATPGQACNASGECAGGTCFIDNSSMGGTTVRSNRNLFFVPGMTDVRSFEWAAPGGGEQRNGSLSGYRQFGTRLGLLRDQDSLVGDPAFVSLDPASPDYLRPAVTSIAVGAADPAYAPPFDIDGTPRGAAPTIGALEGEGDPGPTTTTLAPSTTTTTTSLVTTTSTSTTTSLVTTTSTTTTTSLVATTSTSTTTSVVVTTSTSTTTTTTPPDDTVSALYAVADAPPQLAGLDSPVELGVRFTVSQPARLTAIRAYLAGRSGATYPVALYRAATGESLGTGSFAGMGTGWHEAPVSAVLEPGVEYVASYHTEAGGYGFEADAFLGGVVRGILRAPASSAGAPNGLHRYGAPGVIPSRGYRNAGYYVTPVVEPETPGTTTTTTIPSTGCGGEPATLAAAGDASTVNVDRFRLRRVGDAFELRASGRFPFRDESGLAAQGLAVSVEDAEGRTLFAQVVEGSELAAGRRGWSLAAPRADLQALGVRAGSTRASVTIRATMPAFALMDETGMRSGALRWRVRLGANCGGAATLSCVTTLATDVSCRMP